jgi:multidrug efflux pump subunit AcrA (membrane-fusion protein)
MSVVFDRKYQALGLLTFILAAGCGQSVKEPSRPAPPPPTLPVAASQLDCTGTLRPAHIFALRVRRDEIVDRVHVKAGVVVQAGALLATLSSPDLQKEWVDVREKLLSLGREAGQIELQRRKKSILESRLPELRKRIEIEESLRGKVTGYDPQVHARALLDEKTRAEEEIQSLSQEIAQGSRLLQDSAFLQRSLEERASQIEGRLTNLTVRAPFPGTVVRAEPVPDQSDGVLVELQDRSRFDVHGVLWQGQLPLVRQGSLVTITPDFMPGLSWTGTVSSIGFVPVAGTTGAFPRFPVVVSLDERVDTSLLRDGMTAFMRIQRAISTNPQP